MLPRNRILQAALLLSLLVGCRGDRGGPESAQPMPPGAADPETVQRVRQRYFSAYPDSRVGIVIAIEPSGQPFVAVGEIDPAGLRDNEPVLFLDRSGRALTTGRIARVLPDSVHVRYDPPPQGGREPRRGDMAVFRLPAGARTL